MSKFFVNLIAVFVLSSSAGYGAVFNFATTSLSPGFGSPTPTAFGKIEGNNGGGRVGNSFSTVVNSNTINDNLSLYNTGTQLKSTASDPSGSFTTLYGGGTVSASVSYLDNVGFQVSLRAIIDNNSETQVWTKGQFKFSIDNNATYSFAPDLPSTSGLLLSQNYVRLYDSSSNLLPGSGTLLSGQVYTVDFQAYASINYTDATYTSFSTNVSGKEAELNSTMSIVASGGAAVPETASIAVFGLIGFAGFAARRFRKK